MADLRRVVNAHVSAMIDGYFGCLDAACETINARLGTSVNKGTLSKRLQGQYDWPVSDIIALEDASGRYPITRMMARRLVPDERTARGSLLMHASACAKETGEALSAILAAQQSGGGGDDAQAIREIDEAIAELRAARAFLTQKERRA